MARYYTLAEARKIIKAEEAQKAQQEAVRKTYYRKQRLFAFVVMLFGIVMGIAGLYMEAVIAVLAAVWLTFTKERVIIVKEMFEFH